MLAPQSLRIADEFWLTGHDMAGQPGLGFAKRHFRAGAAGALVGELVIKGHASVRHGQLFLLKWEPLSDPALDALVDRLYEDEQEAREQWKAEQAQKKKRLAQQRQDMLDAWQEQQRAASGAWRPRHQAAVQPPAQGPWQPTWPPPSQQPPTWPPPAQQPWQPTSHDGPDLTGDAWIPPPHNLRKWVEWLSFEDRSVKPRTENSRAENAVINRISQVVPLDVEKQRRLFRPPKVWKVPRDSAVSGNSALRIKRALEIGEELLPSDQFLLALFKVTELHLHALADLTSLGRSRRDAEIAELDRENPMLKEVVDAVASIVGSSTMSGLV